MAIRTNFRRLRARRRDATTLAPGGSPRRAGEPSAAPGRDRRALSLAAKCMILFGTAVLLIVLSALFVPWLRMRDLVHEQNLTRARQLARVAAAPLDPSSGGLRPPSAPLDWEAAQRSIDLVWRRTDAPPGDTRSPRLIPLSRAGLPPAHADDRFLRRSVEVLAARPGLREAPPLIETTADGRTRYRMVRAIRGGQRTASIPPDALGIEAGTDLLGVVAVDFVAPAARFDLLTNATIIAMSAALALVLATLVFYLITTRLILRPVRDLRDVAEQVSAGNHDVRSTIATGDEFEDLARAFNAMLAHLESARRELEASNRSLDTRLGELAELNVRLFEANTLKGQFLANVSHELRTPLASIIGFAELLREGLRGGFAPLDPPGEQAAGRPVRYAENILSSGRLLLAIINDLLDLAKIEAGRMELNVGPVDLAEMAAALVDFVQPLAIKGGLTLVADVAADPPVISSDSGRLQQVLYNLLSNAIKFTPAGGRVELRVRRPEPGRVQLTVTDTGVGIPAEQLERVFEAFVQLDGSTTREHGGTGLGLTITRELVQLLGGTIAVASEVGRGSVFTIHLPAEPPDAERRGRTLTGSVPLNRVGTGASP